MLLTSRLTALKSRPDRRLRRRRRKSTPDTLAGGSGSGADLGDVLVGSASEIDEAFMLDFDDLIDQT